VPVGAGWRRRVVRHHAQPLADEVVRDFIHLGVAARAGHGSLPEGLVDRVREARLEGGVELRVEEDFVAGVAIGVERRVQPTTPR